MKKLIIAIVSALTVTASAVGVYFAVKDDGHKHAYDNACDTTCECGYERTVTHDLEWKFDADGHYQDCKTTSCEYKTEKENHSFSNACDETCDCGYQRTVTHDFSGGWESDATHHYHKCQFDGCEVTDTKVEHSYDNDCDATCDCGYERTVPHDLEWKFDADGHYQDCKTASCEYETEKENHAYDNVCDTTCVCGYERTVTHDFSGEWVKDETYHYHVCQTQGCGAEESKVEHDFDDGEVTKPATPDSEGEKTYTCETCGKTKVAGYKYAVKLTEQQWKDAMNYVGDYVMTIRLFSEVDGREIEEGTQITIVSGDIVQVEEEHIIQKVGDKYYSYQFTIKSRENGDEIVYEDVWLKEEGGASDFNRFKTQFKMFANSYSAFTHNEETDSYVMSSAYMGDLGFKFKDGKLSEYFSRQEYEDDGVAGVMITKATIEWKTAQINLPTPGVTAHVHNYYLIQFENIHMQYCRCGSTKNSEEHDFVDGVCAVCDYVDGTPAAHGHYYTMQVVEPKCDEQGYDLYSCSCGEEYRENFTNELGHKFKDGICERCEVDEQIAALLTFEKLYDEKGIAIGYAITACDTSFAGELTIPETYSGLPILEIASESFKYCSGLTKLTLSKSINRVHERFYGCDSLAFNMYDGNYYLGTQDNPYALFIKMGNLNATNVNFHEDVEMITGYAFAGANPSKIESVEIPNTVISIGQTAFASCSKLANLTFEENSKLEYIGNYAFNSCSVLYCSVILPDTVKFIGMQAFASTKISFINIPDGIESIPEQMLRYADNLHQIVIPKSVKTIEASALVGVYHSLHVFYKGTASDWEKISIDSTNNYYMNYLSYYYYSETEPTDTTSKYWYTSSNGVIPLIWGDADNDMKDYIISKATIKSGYDVKIELYNQDNLSIYLAFRLSGGTDYTGRVVLVGEYNKPTSTRLTMEVYMDYLRPYYNYYSYGEWKAESTVPLIDGSTFTLDTELTFEDGKSYMSDYHEDFTDMFRTALISLNDYIEENETPISFERFGLTAITFDN